MKRSPFRRSNASLCVVAAATDEVEMMLYDEIGYFGISAEDFRGQLDKVTASTIHLRINSPGGDVFDGIAMYNALREHDARVVAHIDGVAASMASMVAMAADEVHMADNAYLMIHHPWALVIGNASDLRKQADWLEKVGGSLTMAYQSRLGSDDPAQLAAWMDEETWFTAAEALAAGFVDEVTSTESDEDGLAVAAKFDLSIYAHAPAALTEPAECEPTTRDLERALRDVGLSQIAAKAFVSAGRAAAEPQRDAEEAGERDVTPEPEPIPFTCLDGI